MDINTLRTRFAIPGILAFEDHNGLTRLQITTPAASATMYLQGAHMTHWQPAGYDPMLLLSRKSEFAPGRPIRGGIPVVFPWFATDSKKDRIDGHPGPSHGFARIQDWTLESVTRHGENIALKLTQGPTEMSRSMGYDNFLLTLDAVIGATLSMQLTVANQGTAELSFEEAFHTYYFVADVHQATVSGLEPTAYIDKTDNFQLKPASGAPIAFTGFVDRVYQNTEAPCTIHSAVQRRDIHVVKTNSHTTVVWNPGKAAPPDLGEWDWHGFVCVETVNAGNNARTLPPGGTFSMRFVASVERWKT